MITAIPRRHNNIQDTLIQNRPYWKIRHENVYGNDENRF